MYVKNNMMKFIRLYISFAIMLLCYTKTAIAQNTDSISYTNHVYNKNIKSITLHVAGDPLSDAVINLNTDEKLHCSFDELYAGAKTYYYIIEHCSANWEKSNIWTNEYLQGIETQMIYSVNASFNTRLPYTHYNFTFPNNSFTLLKSGNYILKVFSQNRYGEKNIVFTRRFHVVDQKILVGADVTRANTASGFEHKQEINVKVNTNGYPIIAPTTDLKIIVLQNGRWDNALTSLKPTTYNPKVIDYGTLDESNFVEAGNEFRYFDIKTLRTVYGLVRDITFDDSVYHVKLYDTESRKSKPYMSEQGIHGNFILKTDDANNVDTQGEYARVNFFLSTPPVWDGNVYVAGNYNGWENTDENKMSYNGERMGYEASILFKQGYYNYIYMVKPFNRNACNVGSIEGNHAQTKNKYTVLVYHRPRGKQYDELIGYQNVEVH